MIMRPTSRRVGLPPVCSKRGSIPMYGRSRGGLTTKLHAVCDGRGRPVRLVLTQGQTSDYKRRHAGRYAAACQSDAGRQRYDAVWFRKALAERGITPCIPSKINRKVAIPHDQSLYRQRHRIENMFARLKDWRRIHTRYDRCAHTFLSAIAFAASLAFARLDTFLQDLPIPM